MRKLKMFSGLLQEISFVAITWNPKSNCICREKNHFFSTEVHRRYQNNTYVTRIFLRVDQWSETTTHQRWQTNTMQHGELRTNGCPWFIGQLFKLSYTFISNIRIAGSSTLHPASTRSESTSSTVRGVGSLARIMGFPTPHLTKKGKRINCNISKYVPFVVPGLSTSSSASSSPVSSTPSSQDTVVNTENPATERSEIMSEESRWNPSHESAQTENQRKMTTTKNYEVIYYKMCQNGYRVSKRIQWIRLFSRINILPALLMNYQWGREQKVVPGPGKHSIKTHFPKDRNCDICLKTKINKDLLQKTSWYSRKNWWFNDYGSQSPWWRMWVSTWSSICCGGTRFGNSAVTILHMQNKNFSGNPEEPTEVPGADEEPKAIYTDNSLEFGKSCEELSWNHCTSTPHRSETNVIAERAARIIKEGTSAVLLQSGLGNEWWAHSMECYCYLRNIQDILSDGKTPYERRFGMPFNRPVILFGAMVEYHPISAKDQSRLHQFGTKVLPGIFLGYASFAGRIWKGDIMVADIEELEEMDASELRARRLNAKEVLTPQRSGNFIFPVADGTVKIFGRQQRQRTSTFTRDRPERREEQEIVQGKSNELHSPTSLQEDSTRDDEEAKSDFWTITREFIHRHHVEPRVKLYVPREESFPFPLKYTGRIVGENYWRLLERHWRKRIVRCMDRLHKFHFIERKATWRICMVRGWDLRGNKQPQDQTMYGQICGSICLMHRKRKQNKDGLSRNQSSTMPDNWEEYSSLNQTTKNSISQWKLLVESWKFRCLIKIALLQKAWIFSLITVLSTNSFRCRIILQRKEWTHSVTTI